MVNYDSQTLTSGSDYLDIMWQENVEIGGAMVSTTVREKIVCVWHIFTLYSNFTITHFWPTSLVPFFSITEKNELPIPPNLVIWFLNVGPFMKLFLIFAMQSHGGNIKKCDCIGRFFLCTRVARQSENHAVQKNADDHGDNRITKPGSKLLT